MMMDKHAEHDGNADETIEEINKKTGRNMPQAIATAVVLIAIIIACLAISMDVFMVLLVVFMILAFCFITIPGICNFLPGLMQ